MGFNAPSWGWVRALYEKEGMTRNVQTHLEQVLCRYGLPAQSPNLVSHWCLLSEVETQPLSTVRRSCRHQLAG